MMKPWNQSGLFGYLDFSSVLHHTNMSIESVLKSERARYSLPIKQLSQFLYTPTFYHQLKALLEAAPTVSYTPNIYNKSRLQLMKDTFRYLPAAYNFYQNNPQYAQFHSHVRVIYSILFNPHQMSGSAHVGMFIKYIELMGTEEHQRLYLEKSLRYEIVGCYAQTEIGHGSDVRSLETTANFDAATQQWVINTPSLSAAKYWPGELSFIANYAMVFAQTIVNGKSKGVYPFLVQIKDAEHNWMPGIEGGDIGPKIGFHAKQNGYMLFANVRIPKGNLFNKYVEISNDGEFKIIGDPRVSYGTMMHIRQLISCAIPKAYGLAIMIGVRYSLFRRQFRDGKKEEVTILEYQTQQDKILTRIAQYYALSVAGTKIRLGSEANSENIRKKDFSLLQETHSNLAFSKCLYSEIVHEGIETIRRGLGGHGTSYYSGIPQILNENLPNNTHEGQNTVMYVQTARYIIKSYLGHLKGKPLTDSVKYLSTLNNQVTPLAGKTQWTLHELREALLGGIRHVLKISLTRLQSKGQNESQMDIFNYKIGNRLQQLAQLHGVYFTVNAFIEAIEASSVPNIKPVITDLCKLFAITQIHRLSEPIIEAAFICPTKFNLLTEEKQRILYRIRPLVIGLVDSFAIPDKYIRSQLATGLPYVNYLDRARECQLNADIQQSQKLAATISASLAKQRQMAKL